MPRGRHVVAAVLALARAAAGAPTTWADDFTSYDSALWVQQTDIEHCSDGACFLASPDHLHYGKAGLTNVMSMSPCNTTGCCVGSKCASWASGHISTVDNYLYGTYYLRGTPAHATDGGVPPKNAFSCWTPTYVGSPHNEIAVCFSGLNSRNIHFSYWYDATAHTTKVDLPFDWSQGVHEYAVVWAPAFIEYYVDGELWHTDTGAAGSTIPSRAGHSIVILRPKDDTYISDSAFIVEAANYTSEYPQRAARFPAHGYGATEGVGEEDA